MNDSRRGAAVGVVAVAAVLAVLVAALGAVATMRASRAHAVTDARQGALAAADGVATVLSYDYRHLDTDLARAEALLTPKFRADYRRTTEKAVLPLARKYKARSAAQVTGASVVSADPDRAVVLVFTNQVVTNTNLAQPRLDRSRINVTFVHSGGRWLIDDFQVI